MPTLSKLLRVAALVRILNNILMTDTQQIQVRLSSHGWIQTSIYQLACLNKHNLSRLMISPAFMGWRPVLGYNHNDPAHPSVSLFLFIRQQDSQTASIYRSDCCPGTAISGSQYNASPVPSEPTMQNTNHNPSTCLPRWKCATDDGWELKPRQRQKRSNHGEACAPHPRVRLEVTLASNSWSEIDNKRTNSSGKCRFFCFSYTHQ